MFVLIFLILNKLNNKIYIHNRNVVITISICYEYFGIYIIFYFTKK